MKPWVRRVLGLPDESQSLQTGKALDDYVIVKKKDLDAILEEVHKLRVALNGLKKDLE